MAPSAKQVIDITNGNKITPNIQTLEEILLQPNVRDKQVCVISITGTFRQGKSFLLNFFIRYLTLKYKLKKVVSDKWLDAKDGKISGFPWKCGSQRHTVGILMWSEVYLANLLSGEEVAIILMDTQGTFDNQTTKQQCAGIFAISTLISSVQIYNLKDKINQFDLEHLECFSGYGQLIRREDLKFRGTPFQNLCFLIRDWQYYHQRSYGAVDGEGFLNEVLNGSDQPLEIRKQNMNIRSLFEKITCFLMPHPGEKVATEPSFEGSLDDINPAFLTHVEHFVSTILAPENLVPKKVNGTKIKVSDLFYYIQDYCKHFMNQDTPELKSVLMATTEASYKIASEECERLYQSLMVGLLNINEALASEDFQAIHAEAKKQAMENFDTRKMLGGRDMKLKYREMLSQALDQKFREYKQLNDSRLNRDLEFSNQKDRHQQMLDQQTRQLTKEYDQEFDRKKTEIEEMIKNRKEELRKHDQNKTRKSAIPAHLRSRIAAIEEPDRSARVGRESVSDDGFLLQMCNYLKERVRRIRYQLQPSVTGLQVHISSASQTNSPSTSYQSTWYDYVEQAEDARRWC